MDVQGKKDDLRQVYNMCIKEMDAAGKFLEDFKVATFELFNSTNERLDSCDYPKNLMDYADTLSYMTFLTDCMRKVNIDFELKAVHMPFVTSHVFPDAAKGDAKLMSPNGAACAPPQPGPVAVKERPKEQSIKPVTQSPKKMHDQSQQTNQTNQQFDHKRYFQNVQIQTNMQQRNEEQSHHHVNVQQRKQEETRHQEQLLSPTQNSEVPKPEAVKPKKVTIKQGVKKYTPGSTFNGVITFVESAQDRLFYVNDVDNDDYAECIQVMKEAVEQTNPLDDIPSPGIFALFLDGYVFRALHNGRDEDESQNGVKFLLIDFGETVSVSTPYRMHPLPELYQNMPPQAIRCRLVEVVNDADCDLPKYLQQNVHVQHKVHVLGKSSDGMILNVELKPDLNPFRGSLRESYGQTTKKYTNPFAKYKLEPADTKDEELAVTTEQTNTKKKPQESATATTNGYHKMAVALPRKPDSQPQAVDLSLPKSMMGYAAMLNSNGEAGATAIIPSNGPHSRHNELSEDERQILFEEPLNTNSALKAVIGYEPQDERRLCRHYDPKTGGCFKGTNCRLEHLPPLKDGYTRDRELTLINVPNEIEYPAMGTTIKIIPTQVLNVEEFFAQIVHPKSAYGSTLKELIFTMNGVETVCTFKKLKKPPAKLDLVLSLYSDGLWYRAKIINIIDDSFVKIFYVDFGNSEVVPITKLREWEPKFSYLPFQAVKCRLYGIQRSENKMCFEAISLLQKTIVDQLLVAEVKNNIDELVVNLYDAQEFPVSEMLIALGYAKKAICSEPVRTYQIPG